MLTEFFAGLEGSALAAGLRGSVWAYPLVNTAHIVGIALLFGGIVPLDLRLLGAFRSVRIAALSRVLVPVAVTGLVLAAAAGSLLFITDARDYAGSNLFRAKMVVVALAVANALSLRRVAAWRAAANGAKDSESASTAPRLTAAAVLSIGLWLTAITLGRLVGYF